MLRQAEIELTLPEGEKLNQSMGSVLHGALMGIISPEWAAAMHEEKVRPYSQYVTLKVKALLAHSDPHRRSLR